MCFHIMCCTLLIRTQRLLWLQGIDSLWGCRYLGWAKWEGSVVSWPSVCIQIPYFTTLDCYSSGWERDSRQVQNKRGLWFYWCLKIYTYAFCDSDAKKGSIKIRKVRLTKNILKTKLYKITNNCYFKSEIGVSQDFQVLPLRITCMC